MPTLTVSIVDRDAVTVLALRGSITAATVLRLEAALTTLLHRVRPRIVIDLSKISALDSTALTMLTVTAGIARDQDGELRLAAPTADICPALRDSGTMAAIATYGSVEGAVRGEPADLLAAPTAAEHCY